MFLTREKCCDDLLTYYRWGRVGYKGQTNFSRYGGNLDEAKSEFSKKFHDKTRNHWAQRDQFEKVAGKYDLVKMDYSNTDGTTDEVDNTAKPKSSTVKDEPAESKLPSSVQDLIR